jgi:tRNA-2-methylthio-N6-dimethylallyladenosine synthase
VKSERLARLFTLSESLLAEHLAGLVGSLQEVLVEGPSKSGEGLVSGRSAQNEIVHVSGSAGLDVIGERVEVRIVRANKHSLEGELTVAARERGRAAAPRPKGRRALPLVLSE